MANSLEMHSNFDVPNSDSFFCVRTSESDKKSSNPICDNIEIIPIHPWYNCSRLSN